MRDGVRPAGDDDPGGGIEGLSDRSAGAGRVSRDMEGIFGPALSTPADKKEGGSDAIVPILAPGARGRRRSSGRAPLLVLSGALIAGGVVWMALPSQQAPSGPLPERFEMARQPLPRPVPQPDVRLAQAAVQPPILPAASPAASPAALSATTGERAGSAGATVTPQTRSASTAKPDHPKRSSAQKQKARSARSSANRSCSGLSRTARARCMRPQVLTADRQLRKAYASAIRAGVDRKTLTTYRNRWARIGRKANSDPAYVTASFRRMARQLDAARHEL